MHDVLHVRIACKTGVVNLYNLPVLRPTVSLVETEEHLVELGVDTPVEQWYLHDYAIMGKAGDKRVGHSRLHLVAIIVIGFVADVNHWLLNIAHPMAKQIYCHHGQGMLLRTLARDIFLPVVLCTKILAET